MAAQREWYEKDYYKVLGVSDDADGQGHHQGVPQAGARAATPTPTPATPPPRSASRRSARPTTCSATRPSARSTTRSAGSGPIGGGSKAVAPAGRRLQLQRRQRRPRRHPRADVRSRPARRRPVGGGRPAARRRCRGDAQPRLRRRRARASPPRCTSPAMRSAARATAAAPSPGTQPKVCSNCGGRGVIDDNQGMFSFSSPCRVCGGRGVVITDPCPTCHGTGIERRPREVQARIPAGVADGQKIRLKGRGAPGRNGGPPGDLIVECHVAPHRLFGRDGNNLTVKVPVTFAEAALGGDVDVPTLDGPRVMLRLRARHASPARATASRARASSPRRRPAI